MYSLLILDQLEQDAELSLSELSRAVGIHKSRTLRLCGTMERMGYIIRRNDDAKFILGPRLLSLGKAFERQNPLLQTLRPELRELSRELDENISFQVIDGERRLFLCTANRPHTVRYLSPEGAEGKFPYGASSKVLLAWGPAELREQILSEAPYPRYTEYTVTTQSELLRSISETLKQGYAISREERTYGTAALAVPVFSEGEKLLGSLSISTTVNRCSAAMIERVLPRLRKTADFISSMTGGAEKSEPVILRKDD